MSKRLHDTEIWRGKWFRTLPDKSKLLWLYLLDTCNCAGIVEINDLEQIKFFIGCKITEENIKDVSKQLKTIDHKRVLILDFIDFQYGRLHEGHKMFKKVTSELAKFDIKYPIDTLSIQIEDTVKDKDIISNINITNTTYTDEFNTFWAAYPRKIAKGAAIKAWKRIPAGSLPLILTALQWQIKSEQWTKEHGQYIPYPATYLNSSRWEDQPTALHETGWRPK
jgi:hypothetical protein